MRRPGQHTLLTLAAAVPLLLAAACANMGRPEGGPRDQTPPVFMRSDPAPGQTDAFPGRISIYFDENIQLDDPTSKVVVSPAQTTPPQVFAGGRRLTVELRDSLRPNTTYTIDFADAIKDLNEGNVLDGFALDFSTGPTIDTLRISGTVLQASNLEPAQGMLVGVYSNLADSAVRTLPLDRIARTNQLGQFTIRNLPDGEYRVFAINDLNRDYHWDRSEDVAFLDYTVRPTVENITVTDTLFGADGSDSLSVRPGVRYLPNDLLLTWFNQEYKPQYLHSYKREQRRTIDVILGAPTDSATTLTIVDGAPGAGRPDSLWAFRQVSAHGDSLRLWITDPEVIAADSLRLALRYVKSDSLDRPVWANDTLRFYFREPRRPKNAPAPKREYRVDTISGDTTWLPSEYFSFRMPGGKQDLNVPLRLESSIPWGSIDTSGVHLQIKQDTLWTDVPFAIAPDSSLTALRRAITSRWQPGAQYRLTVDSAAIAAIYPDIHNKPFSQNFSTAAEEDYSSLILSLPGTDSLQMVVEILNSSDAPVYTAVKPTGTTSLTMKYLNPGTYFLRATADANQNGKWDTGNLDLGLQPEDVYYFPRKLNLRKNWEVEQEWNIDDLAVDAQKPYAIKKNKPALKRGEAPPVDPDDEADQEYQNQIDPFSPVPRGGHRNAGSGGRRQMTGPGFAR